jgi:hypothetical protein
MKNKLRVLAIATPVLLFAASARADEIYTANFTGLVFLTQGATGQAIGSTVSGHFDLDATTGKFLDFMIAGKSVAAGYTSIATIGPGRFDGIYEAQVSPLLGGSTNSTFTLDLSSLTSWPSTDTAFTLLTDKTQLTTNLDTIGNPLSAFPSTFGYFTADAAGGNVVSLTANLVSITTSAVPEPASIALFVPVLLAAGFAVRRRG